MGFFAGLNEEKYDRQYTDRELTRRIIGYFKPQAKRFATVTGLVVVIAGIGAALPVVVQRNGGLTERRANTDSHQYCWIDHVAHRHCFMGAELGAAQSCCARCGRCGSRSAHTRLPCRGRT